MADLINNNNEINDEDLINVVRGFPELWNKSCTAYRNNRRKDGAWIRISERLHKPIEDLKSRWKTIRDKYVREKKIMDGSKKSGSAASNREVWELFETLNFLKDSVSHRKTCSNMGKEIKTAEKPSLAEELVMETDNGEFIVEETTEPSEEDNSLSKHSSSMSNSNISNSKTSSTEQQEERDMRKSLKYKRPKQKPDPYEETLLKIWKENNDKIKGTCDSGPDDPDRLFLLSLEKDFKSLNNKNKRKAKHALMEVLENLIDNQELENSLSDIGH